MKILYWTEFFWPSIGGVEILSCQLIDALVERGYEFRVVTSHHPAAPPIQTLLDHTVIHRFPFQTSLSQRNLRAIKQIVQEIALLKREFEPDVLHLNTVFASTFFHHITQSACRAPSVVTVHFSIPLFDAVNGLPLKILRSADWVTAVSNATLRKTRSILPQLTEHSSLIYNGLPELDREPRPGPLSPPLFLYLGQLVHQKGVDIALQAFALALTRLQEGRLIIAGDGAERSSLEAQAARLGIADHVEFRGWIAPEHVPDLIDTTTLLLMPSREESFGLAALEAARMARPTLASRIDGLAEVVLDGETGILVEPEDPHSLAEAMISSITNPSQLAAMGDAARRRAREVFTLERMVNGYNLLYERLAGGLR
jgi:glycogen(starch) synthase